MCRNVLVLIDEFFQLHKQGRYSEAHLMGYTHEAHKHFLMEPLSNYTANKQAYDTDPILTLKFYCVLFRNSEKEKQRFLVTHGLINEKYQVAARAETDYERLVESAKDGSDGGADSNKKERTVELNHAVRIGAAGNQHLGASSLQNMTGVDVVDQRSLELLQQILFTNNGLPIPENYSTVELAKET